jgi:hypothetical protein
MLDLICQISPSIGASALAALALVSIVIWRGGTIEKISIPALFEVKLERAVHFRGDNRILYLAGAAFAAAVLLGGLQATHLCERCDGLPGETAWIYVGEVRDGKFTSTVPVQSELNVAPQDIPSGSWITLTEPRKNRDQRLEYYQNTSLNARSKIRDGMFPIRARFCRSGSGSTWLTSDFWDLNRMIVTFGCG